MSVTLPANYHIKLLRSFIARERGMRLRVLRGHDRQAKLNECDQALDSVEALAQLVAPDLFGKEGGGDVSA